MTMVARVTAARLVASARVATIPVTVAQLVPGSLSSFGLDSQADAA